MFIAALKIVVFTKALIIKNHSLGEFQFDTRDILIRKLNEIFHLLKNFSIIPCNKAFH